MDTSTFYALFSATCFTLTGLWWTVVERHPHWLRQPAVRRQVASVYLAFLLPALMGLFAQIGGSESPMFWRVSFVVIAVVGAASTVRFLRSSGGEGAGAFARHWWGSGLLYAAVAVLGVAPGIARGIGVTPLQAEATLLVLLVAMAHALVWEFLTRDRPDPAT